MEGVTFSIRVARFTGIISVASAAALPQLVPKPEADGSLVTWQSAFWSLIPLALNSMTQPAGKVCFLPEAYGAVLRCSPIMCSIDTVMVLEQWIWYTATTLSPFKAAKLVLEFRFQDAESEVAENSLASLQKNMPLRIMVFVFGALPQIIKLYSMTGLFWIKAAGWSYLGSFLVLEVINIAAPRNLRREQLSLIRTTTLVEDYVGYTSVAASVLFVFHIFAFAVISACQVYIDHFKWWHFLLLLFLIAVYIVTTRSKLQRGLLLDLSLGVSFISSIFTGPWATFTIAIFFAVSAVYFGLVQIMFYLNWLTAVISAHITFLLVGISWYNVYRNSDTRRLNFFKLLIPWLYIVLHIVTWLLYLIFRYDSRGTYKPAWADLLG